MEIPQPGVTVCGAMRVKGYGPVSQQDLAARPAA
jgi:hypothetical protein